MSREARSSKEERMQHVVETARSLFISQGYAATSTSQIARESGIVEMTLFRYFPTKRDLFEAVVLPLTSFNWFPADALTEESLPKAKVISLLHNRVNFAKQNRELVRLLVIESYYQPDWSSELNPLSKASFQLQELLINVGLNEESSLIAINLIMGFILTIAFTPNYQEETINSTLNYIEAQLSQLLETRSST